MYLFCLRTTEKKMSYYSKKIRSWEKTSAALRTCQTNCQWLKKLSLLFVVQEMKNCADWRLSKMLNAFFCLVSCSLVFYITVRECFAFGALLLVLACSVWLLVLTFVRSRGFILGPMLFLLWIPSQDLRWPAPLLKPVTLLELQQMHVLPAKTPWDLRVFSSWCWE